VGSAFVEPAPPYSSESSPEIAIAPSSSEVLEIAARMSDSGGVALGADSLENANVGAASELGGVGGRTCCCSMLTCIFTEVRKRTLRMGSVSVY
jgi:hypothetical protein